MRLTSIASLAVAPVVMNEEGPTGSDASNAEHVEV